MTLNLTSLFLQTFCENQVVAGGWVTINRSETGFDDRLRDALPHLDSQKIQF